MLKKQLDIFLSFPFFLLGAFFKNVFFPKGLQQNSPNCKIPKCSDPRGTSGGGGGLHGPVSPTLPRGRATTAAAAATAAASVCHDASCAAAAAAAAASVDSF